MTAKKETGGPTSELRSFGRRRGRKLSARQQDLVDHALPALSLDLERPAPEQLQFASPAGQRGSHGVADVPGGGGLWLEIGFGGGEHLIWQAEHNPDIAFIGCEPFIDGVVKVLAAIQQNQLANIRLYTEDARDVLRWLPEAAVARVFILFPDPWPKKKHQKRRLISAPMLDLLARVMQPGAQLRIGTDIGDYARTILLAIKGHDSFEWPVTGPQDWRRRPADWPETRYERKARAEGRRCYYFRFARAAQE